jgi:hypothetical protein
VKAFTYVLKNSGKSCIATVIRPDGHGVDITTFTSQRSLSDARSRAKKWAEKRVEFYNANFSHLYKEDDE